MANECEDDKQKPSDPMVTVLQQLIEVNQQLLQELQQQTALLANLSQALTPFGGKS